MSPTAEQQARDLLEACGVEDAQRFTAGDVVALANYVAEHNRLLAIDVREMVRLLHAAATWIAGAIAEDPTGEPWTGTRTLLNELITHVDAHGGWPPEEAAAR